MYFIIKAVGRGPYVSAFLIGATVIKIAFASVLGWAEDVGWYHLRAEALLTGKDLFDPRYILLIPLVGEYLIPAVCLLFAQAVQVPFGFAIKLPAIFSDLGIALLLYGTPQASQWAPLLYMINPVSILLSTYHGQIHTVALFLTVLALWLSDRRHFALGGMALGLAASVRQHFSAILVPLAKRPEGLHVTVLLVFIVATLLINAPFLIMGGGPEGLRGFNLKYGAWGYSMLLLQGPRVLALVGLKGPEATLTLINQALSTYAAWVSIVWIIIFVVWAWWHPGNQWRRSLLFVLGLYVTSPGFGMHWLVWAVPFFLLVDQRGALIYSTLAGAFILGSYWQWGLNAKYGVESLTANLHILSRADFLGVLLVGILGIFTWLYCAKAALRLVRV